MTVDVTGDASQNTPAELSAELVAQFAQMAMIVPSEDDSGLERIIAQLLSADSWEALNDPWESSNAVKLANRVMRIDSLKRRPSDFRSGLGIFLVVEAVDIKSGEKIVWTTGSVSVVAQLVRAYCLGWLPCFAEIVIAERATQAGYHPHHLEFKGVVNPNPNPPAAPIPDAGDDPAF